MFVSYKEKQGALNALETMLITKEYHLQVSFTRLLLSCRYLTCYFHYQVSKNSTVRKNDYNIVTNPKDNETMDFEPSNRHERALSG